MTVTRILMMVAASALVMCCACVAGAQSLPASGEIPPDPGPAGLVGTWEVFQTKAAGEQYKASYRGQPFVRTGAGAFILIIEYHKDGTFKLTTRVGTTETVQEGTWKLSGHELRHDRKGAGEEEIMYIRFDTPDVYTSVDVYEGSPDPGLFGRFRRMK